MQIRHVGGSSEMAREVRDGRLDLAFVALPGDSPPGVELIPLAREPIMLAVPDGHPLATAAGSNSRRFETRPRSTSPRDGASGWRPTARSPPRAYPHDHLRGQRHRDPGRVHPQRTRDRDAAPIACRDPPTASHSCRSGITRRSSGPRSRFPQTVASAPPPEPSSTPSSAIPSVTGTPRAPRPAPTNSPLFDRHALDEAQVATDDLACDVCHSLDAEPASARADHRDATDASRWPGCLCGFVISHAASVALRPLARLGGR